MLSMKKNTSKQFTKRGAIRIAKEQIPETLNYFSKISNIPIADLHILGSTGKQETSGDIDIALDITKYNPINICVKISNIHKIVNYNIGNKIGSCLIPIEGDPAKGMVQVDFMSVKDIEWAKFAYFSAGDKSKYKGVYRTCLLMGLAAAFEKPEITSFEYNENDVLIFRCGLTFSLNDGLHTICQYRPTYVNNPNKYQKRMVTIPFEQAKQMFPEQMKRIQQPISILNPNEAIRLLFCDCLAGYRFSTENVETYEQLLSLLKQNFKRSAVNKIQQFADERMKSFTNKLEVDK
jgi:hypothetical protein